MTTSNNKYNEFLPSGITVEELRESILGRSIIIKAGRNERPAESIRHDIRMSIESDFAGNSDFSPPKELPNPVEDLDSLFRWLTGVLKDLRNLDPIYIKAPGQSDLPLDIRKQLALEAAVKKPTISTIAKCVGLSHSSIRAACDKGAVKRSEQGKSKVFSLVEIKRMQSARTPYSDLSERIAWHNLIEELSNK